MALRNVIGWIDFSELSIIIRRCGKKGRGLVSLERSRAPRCAWLLAFRGFPILAQERARPYWRQFAHAQSWPETDSFSHTDSWRRPSGGLLTPSQPRRRRDAPLSLIRPSLPSNVPIVAVYWRGTEGLGRTTSTRRTRSNNNNLHWNNTTALYVYIKKEETIFMDNDNLLFQSTCCAKSFLLFFIFIYSLFSGMSERKEHISCLNSNIWQTHRLISSWMVALGLSRFKRPGVFYWFCVVSSPKRAYCAWFFGWLKNLEKNE